MNALPAIDPARFLPSFPDILENLEELAIQTARFSERYEGALDLLTREGLIEAITQYARLQETSEASLYIADFIKEKFGYKGDSTQEHIRNSNLDYMVDLDFFTTYLRRLPVETLQGLSQEPALFGSAPLLRSMMHPAVRQQSFATAKALDEVTDRLDRHLNSPSLDRPAFMQLFSLSEAMTEAAQHGFKDPLLAAQAKNFLGDAEVAALRHVVLAHRDILRAYIEERNIEASPEHYFSKKIIDTRGVLDWKTAAGLTVKSFEALAPELGETAENVFKLQLIEASPLAHGQNRALMGSPLYPPVIFAGFQGSLFQAQELSHKVALAVHFMHRNVSGEMTPFHSSAIDEILPDLQDRMFWHQVSLRSSRALELSAGALDNVVANIARFSMIDKFQSYAHHLLTQEKRVKVRELDRGWREIHENYFGDATKADATNWRTTLYLVEKPFEGIAHLYAQLVAERMWQEHKKDPTGFATKFLPFLSAGSSKPPRDLLKPMGFDTTDPAFWSEAFRDIRSALGAATGKPVPAPRL